PAGPRRPGTGHRPGRLPERRAAVLETARPRAVSAATRLGLLPVPAAARAAGDGRRAAGGHALPACLVGRRHADALRPPGRADRRRGDRLLWRAGAARLPAPPVRPARAVAARRCALPAYRRCAYNRP